MMRRRDRRGSTRNFRRDRAVLYQLNYGPRSGETFGRALRIDLCRLCDPSSINRRPALRQLFGHACCGIDKSKVVKPLVQLGCCDQICFSLRHCILKLDNNRKIPVM